MRLNLRGVAADNEGVDQVSRPMQIALVAIVLLAGMWFTVLKPKPAADPAAPAAQPTAPGVAGLGRAVNAAKGAAAASNAANDNIQKATGGTATTAAPAATAAKPSAARAVASKTTKSVKPAAPAKKAAAKPAPAAKAAAPVDPSGVLLSYLAKGKTVVLLFHGNGADDKGARQAVHRVALHDKNVVAAYAPVSKVAAYRAITTDVEVTTAPTILVISSKKKAVALTGFVDFGVVRQTVGDVRAAAGQKR